MIIVVDQRHAFAPPVFFGLGRVASESCGSVELAQRVSILLTQERQALLHQSPDEVVVYGSVVSLLQQFRHIGQKGRLDTSSVVCGHDSFQHIRLQQSFEHGEPVEIGNLLLQRLQRPRHLSVVIVGGVQNSPGEILFKFDHQVNFGSIDQHRMRMIGTEHLLAQQLGDSFDQLSIFSHYPAVVSLVQIVEAGERAQTQRQRSAGQFEHERAVIVAGVGLGVGEEHRVDTILGFEMANFERHARSRSRLSVGQFEQRPRAEHRIAVAGGVGELEPTQRSQWGAFVDQIQRSSYLFEQSFGEQVSNGVAVLGVATPPTAASEFVKIRTSVDRSFDVFEHVDGRLAPSAALLDHSATLFDSILRRLIPRPQLVTVPCPLGRVDQNGQRDEQDDAD
ncbi:hypothetical protein Tsp_02934 [Trichinella spiralis]|uniref:hypothetical protein n=1 Tax=Trichinella spiralis TaxID=6334 RepID=UPI0001EFCDA8|nr:hypothetical protein Tsp_02934 [Trichinella spiralis]